MCGNCGGRNPFHLSTDALFTGRRTSRQYRFDYSGLMSKALILPLQPVRRARRRGAIPLVVGENSSSRCSPAAALALKIIYWPADP
jgi:hypothetical protein